MRHAVRAAKYEASQLRGNTRGTHQQVWKRTCALQHAAGIALRQVAAPQAGDGHKCRVDLDGCWHC